MAQLRVEVEQELEATLEERSQFVGVVFKEWRISISGADAAPMLSLPGFVIGDAHLADRHLLVLAFCEGDAEALHSVWPGDVASVAQAAFLKMFASLQADGFMGPKDGEPGDGWQKRSWEQRYHFINRPFVMFYFLIIRPTNLTV